MIGQIEEIFGVNRLHQFWMANEWECELMENQRKFINNQRRFIKNRERSTEH